MRALLLCTSLALKNHIDSFTSFQQGLQPNGKFADHEAGCAGFETEVLRCDSPFSKIYLSPGSPMSLLSGEMDVKLLQLI